MKLLPIEYAMRNLGRSPLRLGASVLGSALVVGVVMAAGAFVIGMERSMVGSSSARNVILLGAGSEESTERSQIGMDVPTQVAASVPGIARYLGVDYVSPEVHMAVVVRTAPTGPPAQAVMRGFTPPALLVHPQVRIVAGRLPLPGHDELLVGALAATRLGVDDAELAVGRRIWLDERPWTITGRFTAPGTVMDAEMWTPLADLQIATRRDTLSCVVLTLDDAAFEDVELWCAQRLDLELVALRESDYYASLLAFYRPVRLIVWATAVLMAVGGLLGGLNTMYAAFASRVRELGALQTLGFPRRAVVLSFLQESCLATVVGGLCATGLILLLLDGRAVRVSMGAVTLTVDGAVVLAGLAAGAVVAVAGIVPPLYRCLRLPIPEALRAG